MIRIGLVFVFLGLSFGKNDDRGAERYAGYFVYLTVENENSHVPLISTGNVSILTENRDGKFKGKILRTYLVPSTTKSEFFEYLKEIKAGVKLLIEDLGKFIQKEKDFVEKNKWKGGDKFESKIYLSYEETENYLQYIRTIRNPSNKDYIARLDNLGTTHGNREMYGVRISSNHKKNKPVIFIEAGIHAREWSAPAAARYIISQLVENYSKNAQLLSNIDFYIIPVSNPDGYEYSRTVDRLWLKNRAPQVNGFQGVDLNRNFHYNQWALASSYYPESDKYKGPAPFSEKETQHIQTIARRLKSRVKAFVSIQSGNGRLMYPWAFTFARAPKYYLTRHVAVKAVEAIFKAKGGYYQTDQSYVLQYDSAGTIDDYLKGEFDLPIAYTLQLSSHGKSGFLLPVSEVIKIIKGAFEGIKVIAKFAPNPPDEVNLEEEMVPEIFDPNSTQSWQFEYF